MYRCSKEDLSIESMDLRGLTQWKVWKWKWVLVFTFQFYTIPTSLSDLTSFLSVEKLQHSLSTASIGLAANTRKFCSTTANTPVCPTENEDRGWEASLGTGSHVARWDWRHNRGDLWEYGQQKDRTYKIKIHIDCITRKWKQWLVIN